MKESFSQDTKIDELKPKMATLESLDHLDVTPNETVVTAKLDGEFTLLAYDRNGESYTLNKWGHRRSDYPALNQLTKKMKQTPFNHIEFLCEIYAMDNKPLKLPQFISLIKGEHQDLTKIHIAIWDLLSIDGKPITQPFDWKMQEVETWIKGCTHVAVVPYLLPRTLQDVKNFWNEYVLEKGYEGLVIRDRDRTYKIKPTLEVDAVVIGLNKKTSYGKALDLFQKGQITSVKLALMQHDGTFLELSDCASGITADLRTVLWKLMDYKVGEDDKTVYIKPLVVCTVQYTDTYPRKRQALKFDGEKYVEAYWKHFVSLRHPRLLGFRPDKNVTPQDLRITQIPENKLPEEEPLKKTQNQLNDIRGKMDSKSKEKPLLETEKVATKPEGVYYKSFKTYDEANKFAGEKGKEYPAERYVVAKPEQPYHAEKPYEVWLLEKPRKEEVKPSEDVLNIVREMEKATLGEVHDEIRKDWKPQAEEPKIRQFPTHEWVEQQETVPFEVSEEQNPEETLTDVKVYTPIVGEDFDEVFDRLYAEGWAVNTAQYMQGDTPEESVFLQAKSFPCLEFQPVLLPKPTQRHSFIREGKWIAFHRTPKERKPEECSRQVFGDYYNCIAHYRQKCPPPLQQLCKEKSVKDNDYGDCDICGETKHITHLEQCEVCLLIICDQCHPTHKHENNKTTQKQAEIKTDYVGWICRTCGWRKAHGRTEAIDHVKENEGHDVGWIVNGEFEPLKTPSLKTKPKEAEPVKDSGGQVLYYQTKEKPEKERKQRSMSDFF